MSLLLVLALFFFAGVILGQVFSARVPDATGDELACYLTDFLKVEEGDLSPGRLCLRRRCISAIRWRRFCWALPPSACSCSRW